MKRFWLILLALILAQPAWAKQKYCLTPAEYNSELIIRHGIFLREMSRRCNEKQPGSLQLWLQFDQQFGSRLKAERTKRENAFKREFPNDWLKAITTFDARIVTYNRNLPFTSASCEDIKSLLDDNSKKGWSSFIAQSRKIRDLAHNEVNYCP